MLVNPNNQQVLSVLPIVGMGGSGKTFLAKLVYNHNQVEGHFNKRVWVYVSDDFDVKRILRKVLESLTGNACALDGKDAILRSLKKELEGKKYLLVLDDVWSEDLSLWEDLRDCLSSTSTSTGNGVIVTTRIGRVASNTGTLPRHDLEKLSHEDCWAIFDKIAFAAGGPSRTSQLEAIGWEIIKKCAGLPLAAKVLGGMMHSRMDICEWISIQNSEIWNLPEDESGILHELKLSFIHLPYPTLKDCFAYCSIFPKDFKFEKDDLIQLWMAQGLLHPTRRNDEMEDVGNFYLNILLSNFLFQDVEKTDYDDIKFFKMHELVHDLALSVSKYDCLTLKDGYMHYIFMVRHLSVILDEDKMSQDTEESTKKLHTLFSSSTFFSIATKIKCLWALNLEGSGIEELPISIGKMIHLRYLNVSWTKIKVLPDTITKLYNFETLRLLRCWNLEKIPKGFQKLVRLRHLYMEDHSQYWTLMPSRIGNLTCLQTLPFFVIKQEKGHRIEELGPVDKLKGELKIYGLKYVKNREEAEGAELLKKSKIQKLELNWTIDKREEGTNNDKDVLEGLKPPEHLKGLTITNFGGGKFASWMMMGDGMLLQSLVEIELRDCKRCENIPTLGHLPCLKHVELCGLHNVRRISDEFYGISCSSGAKVFPELRSLSLVDMPKLEEWLEASSSSSLSLDLFPCLEKLLILSCPQLISCPGHFPFLKELDIRRCNMVAMEKMSSKVTSLTSLCMVYVGGESGLVDGILQELLENNSKSLGTLHIEGCKDVFTMPRSLQRLVSLNSLTIEDCENLTHVLAAVHVTEETESCSSNKGLTSLRTLRIFGCHKLACFPKGFLGTLASLEMLSIMDCRNLIVDPDHYDEICCLTSPHELEIMGCIRLATAWQQGLFSPLTGQLQSLIIGPFSEELEYFPWPEASDVATAAGEYQCPFVSLKSLQLYGYNMTKIKSLPHQLQHLNALTSLQIEGFLGLETLPEWLGNLSSLRQLCLWCCDNLSNLPSSEAMQRLTNLQKFAFYGCPLLKERCAKGSGSEWHKISHIQDIDIRY